MRSLLASLFVLSCAFSADEVPTPATSENASAEKNVASDTPAETKKRQAYLGIAIDDAATSFDKQGLVILRVEPQSPAAVMGLAAGDRLLRVDGTPLTSREEIQRLLANKQPGDRISIDAVRVQGRDGSSEPFSCSGIMQELPRSRTSNLGTQLDQLQNRLAELEEQSKEPTLAEILERLQTIEKDLPKAAAAFKRIYPDGEFRLILSLEITSHKTAIAPIGIEVGGRVKETNDDAVTHDAIAHDAKPNDAAGKDPATSTVAQP
jgi:membrane-associated protease RseP (regulator of RpoE activity)